MFGRKKQRLSFDRNEKQPVLRASICTGERVVGFKDMRTGAFTEMALIRSDAELKEFMQTYGIADNELRREW